MVCLRCGCDSYRADLTKLKGAALPATLIRCGKCGMVVGALAGDALQVEKRTQESDGKRKRTK